MIVRYINVVDLQDDDDKSHPNVHGAFQLHDAPLPQTQTHEASDFNMSVQRDFYLPQATRAPDALTHSLRASCPSSG
jgi:hypothetical protein